MIEAAIAHYYSTNSKRFLNIMKRFADCIDSAFKLNVNEYYSTPGDQELELALVRLWQATGEERYLELSKHFVDRRWNNALYRPNGSNYTIVTITTIPYFAYANREAGDMAVWLKKEFALS
ncbi:beta-L-arabinofuranosidase domain-containing protein [Paenibacillus spongiae]|uniref:Glycoside hydrolase family 127 protein n=1 Tax=Paenibacillus spongiae TaxID=2909671 RepID=A0ABY5S5V1_9BACL|nr:beta-L-arabinofuranosidase domain-containing protein [Paenibacillus spongiae]UVI29286.1 glycoside hydrolase family 127 protein [Paenibacillus spongiae]